MRSDDRAVKQARRTRGAAWQRERAQQSTALGARHSSTAPELAPRAP